MAAPTLKEAITAKIRKLEMLRELAEDPETEQMLRSIFAGNGHGVPEATPERSPEIHPSPFEQDRARAANSVRGGLTKLVYDILATAKEPTTTEWIAANMTKSGYIFKAAKPQIAVNEALRTLENKGLAQVTGKIDGVRKLWRAISAQKAERPSVDF